MLLNRTIISVLSVLLLHLLTAPAYPFDRSAYESFARDATLLEHQNKWKSINWYENCDEALRVAQRENKPLMVFLVVNHFEQKGAGDC